MKINWKLTLVIAIAAVLRLWHLGINPPSLTPDEAALGYNAYSVLKTGRDEYGTFMPIIFKSFGDFKPGFYIYSAVPSVAIFGLTEFAVRLPSAVAGIVAVWLVYKIVLAFLEYEFFSQGSSKKLSTSFIAKAKKDRQNDKKRLDNGNLLALLSAVTLALSPWHIHFSRGAWEVNLALTLTLGGLYFLLKSLQESSYLPWSALLFGLTLITYQGAKISVLIVLVVVGFVYFSQLKKIVFEKKNRINILKAGGIGLVFAIPILLSFTSGQTGRLKVFSVFSYRRPEEYLTKQLDLAKVEFGSAKYYLYYSEVLNTARGIMGRWFNHFSGKFLFFEGDWANPRHSAPDTGEMLLVDIVLLVVGLGYVATRTKSKYSTFVLLWLVLSPLPSALSRDQVHAVRALNMVIPLTMISAVGLHFLIKKANDYRVYVRFVIGSAITGLYIGCMVIFLDNYFVHQPVHNSQYWEYGYKQVVETVTTIQDQYNTVHVRQSFAQPYIYFLFYQKYDPVKYQQQAHLIESEYGDVGRVEHLDNISFLPIDWTVNRGDFGTLFVADPIRIPPEDSNNENEFKVIKEINYLDDKETAFRIVEVLDSGNVNKK